MQQAPPPPSRDDRFPKFGCSSAAWQFFIFNSHGRADGSDSHKIIIDCFSILHWEKTSNDPLYISYMSAFAQMFWPRNVRMKYCQREKKRLDHYELTKNRIKKKYFTCSTGSMNIHQRGPPPKFSCHLMLALPGFSGGHFFRGVLATTLFLPCLPVQYGLCLDRSPNTLLCLWKCFVQQAHAANFFKFVIFVQLCKFGMILIFPIFFWQT